MKRAILIGIAAVLLAAVVVASIKSGGGKKGVKVYVEEVGRRDITQLVKASGEIDPRVKVNISAHVVGKIEKLYVKEGDPIRAGQPFLQLEQEAFVAARDNWRASLSMASTEVEQARVSLADAKVKLDRARRLAGEGITTREQLEAAELAYASAELQLQHAQETVKQSDANLAKAQDDLGKTTIYAPLSGRVIALNAEEGEVVVSGTMNNPASVIGTIADLSEILAEVDVDETEIVKVELGQEATLRVDALPDQEYQGKVVEVGSSGFARPTQPDVTFFKVKVLFEKPDAELRPGMSVRAEVRTAAKSQVPVVPIQSVVDRAPVPVEKGAKPKVEAKTEEETPVVFVVEKDVVHQQPVKTGLADETHVEIVSGVEAGQQVVSGPYRSLKDLKDGDRVNVSTEAEEKTDHGAKEGGG